MAKTTSQLRTMLRLKLRDPNGTVYDNNSDLDRALEDAQNEIVQNYDFRFNYEEEYSSIVSGTGDYALPTDIMFDRVHWVRVKDSAAATANWRKIFPKSYDWYADMEDSYGTQTGTPTHYILKAEAQTLTLYPQPDYSATDGLWVCYVQKPTDLTTSSDTETVIPDEFVEGLVLLAASKIKEVEEEFEQASYYLARANEIVGRLKSQAMQTKSEKARVRFTKNIYPEI